MKNSSYYIAPVGDWAHDLPQAVASNMVKVSHALNHSATEAVRVNILTSALHIAANSKDGYPLMNGAIVVYVPSVKINRV